MALVSTEVCTMSGRTPASSSCLPLLTASSTPFGDRPTSTQPVNSPSEFQTLSPCLISTNVAMLESLVAAFRPARRAQRRAASRGAWPRHPLGTECRSAGLISFWRCMPVPRPYPRRIATISVHTSPLEQPGTGDAGGLNVYVVEVAKRLAVRGVEVDIFTRAVSRDLPPVAELAPGVLVRHLTAGPFEDLDKADLPGQLCHFTFEVLRAEAAYAPGRYDLVHGHYWLSGQVGAVAKERWGVPLVQSMHTLGRVKNAALAAGDAAEPEVRLRGEAEVVAAADRLVANTDAEAQQLIGLYDAPPSRVRTINPGVDLAVFRPGSQQDARRRLGVPEDAVLLVFAGRVQPLKAPEGGL